MDDAVLISPRFGHAIGDDDFAEEIAGILYFFLTAKIYNTVTLFCGAKIQLFSLLTQNQAIYF